MCLSAACVCFSEEGVNHWMVLSGCVFIRAGIHQRGEMRERVCEREIEREKCVSLYVCVCVCV